MRSAIRTIPAAAALLVLTLAASAAEGDVENVVARLHSALIDVAATAPAPGLEQRIEVLGPVIRQTHDLATMGRLTVRRYSRGWSEEQRTTFLDAFESLSVATYASRFSGISADTFELIDSQVLGDRQAEVRALIRRPAAEDVSMDYLLRDDGEGWRIVNVLADGVSELSLMGSEFFGVLEDGGFAALIDELESRVAAISASEPEL